MSNDKNKLIVGEAPKIGNYVKAIRTNSKYEDGRSFPVNEVITADNEINLSAEDKNDLGGINVSNYENVLRWIIRGDTLCDVSIPEDGIIYEIVSKSCNHGTFRASKIVLSNPRKIDDSLAMKLYEQSNLPWKSYIQVLAYISTLNFKETCYKIVEDKINIDNAQEALNIYDNYLDRRIDPMPKLYVEVLDKIKQLTNGLKVGK